MAFSKFANAKIAKASIAVDDWNQIRASSQKSGVKISSENQIKDYSPDKYLLTHCTIIASVDVEESPKNAKGWGYVITEGTEQFVNSNQDSWERDLLLATYKTFIGGENYCFAPQTKILMADGAYKPISDVQVGDRVISHTGETKMVTQTFCHQVDEVIQSLRFGKYKTPTLVTGNHPFRVIKTSIPSVKPHKRSNPANTVRYVQDQVVSGLRGERTAFGDRFSAEEAWADASQCTQGTFALGPERTFGAIEDLDRAVLLGYYLAEGCQRTKVGEGGTSTGVVITPGVHEQNVVDDILLRVPRAFPGTKVRVTPTQFSTWYVDLAGKEIGQWMLDHGNQHAHTKKVSEDVFGWSREALLWVLASWMNGDGTRHNKTFRIHGNTTSEPLGQQMLRIADLCGIRSSLTFCDVPNKGIPSGYGSYQVANGDTIVFPIIPRHDVWDLCVSTDHTQDIMSRSVRWNTVMTTVSRKRSTFAWWHGKRVHTVTSNRSLSYKGTVHNFEVEDDHSYVVFPGVAVHNCEHIQIPELSKGKIVDAVARDVGDSVYVDILVATDRKHEDLIRDIEESRVTTLSMGCSVEYTICSKCGNVSADDTQLCQCIKYSKGNHFFDKKGKRRKIAELCGHKSDPKSVKFIEASWVANPAFKGAVLRNIVHPEEMKEAAIRAAFETIKMNSPDSIQKAASLLRSAAEFDFGAPEEGGEEEAAPAEAETPAEPDPIKGLTDDLKTYIRNKVKQELQDEMKGPTPSDTRTEDSNENLVRSTYAFDSFKRKYAGHGSDLHLYRLYEGLVSIRTAGWKSLHMKGYTGREVLALSYFVDKNTDTPDPLDKRAYDAIATVGGVDKFDGPVPYLTACARAMGITKVTRELAAALIRKGRLYSYGVGK